jgi:Glyoxalase-like domain
MTETGGMTRHISPREFHGADGVEDRRVLGEGACTHFRTGSFAAGARERRSERNRIHIDVWVPHDQAEARVAAALAAGGRMVTDEHAPAWWTLADPEGNEADVCTWQDTS